MMRSNRLILCLALGCAAMCSLSVRGAVDLDTEKLIDQLPQVSEIGYGYSAMFGGSQFLPEPDSSEVHTLVLGSPAPTNSAVLESIVRRGARAVASLLKHLDDARETRIPPLSGMMWMSFNDEYDYNRRLRKDPPTGVNRPDRASDKNQPSTHTVTVGDLCFVALGQIVNRGFNATRYQPTGGLMVNSPTYSKRLCAVVRADFEGMTEEKHRELLVQDFLMPDHEFRRSAACRRLAFYYPEILEPLVLKQLAVPTYDVYRIVDLVRHELYRNKSVDQRRAIFNEFVRTNGPAFSDGILLRLFDDLNTQEADEQGRLVPRLREKFDARLLLIQLYGFTDAIAGTNKPYVAAWEESDRREFIRALAHYRSSKVDEAVSGILAKIADDDSLALACMNRLIGQGYDAQVRSYCQRRIPESVHFSNELRQIIIQLDSKTNKNVRADGAANRSQGTLDANRPSPAADSRR